MPKLVYITNLPTNELRGDLDSPSASLRYRALVPARILVRFGWTVRVLTLEDHLAYDFDALSSIGDVFVLAKSFNPLNIKFAAQLVRLGKKCFLDLCDNYFMHQSQGSLYSNYITQLAAECSGVICSTRELQKVIFQYTGSGALVIPDPYEGQVRSPSFSPEFPRVKVLWFGHESNIKTLINNASDIYEACKDFPIELIVVSGQAIFEGELANLLDRVFGEPIMLRKVLWSALKVYELFDQVDCVYIPTLSGPYYSVKSSNRMLEALIGGKLVIAGDSPSHRELPGFVSIGQGLRASLADAIVNKPATVTKIISAQDFVVRTYSPFRIAMLWNEAFTSGSPEQQRPKIRLNLGCGDKILTTYINVDLISGRKGRRPDLASDVSDLRSIGDGTVDEILAVHIFEHFYLWEVPKLLSEWARVLRSGGKIVIECPNLAAACAEFHSPHSPGTGDQNFDANTMWVFYGDPSWKDPLMCHRWGYTPSSLASLLSAHGFVHVRQEPAEFKKREPRDMRLVAEKC